MNRFNMKSRRWLAVMNGHAWAQVQGQMSKTILAFETDYLSLSARNALGV